MAPRDNGSIIVLHLPKPLTITAAIIMTEEQRSEAGAIHLNVRRVGQVWRAIETVTGNTITWHADILPDPYGAAHYLAIHMARNQANSSLGLPETEEKK